jgi:DNA (cytosine-5)-methyltransferase 1
MGADDFKITSTLNQALFGFGDAVCVPVIRWIAGNYLNPLLEELRPEMSAVRPAQTGISYLRKPKAKIKAV